MDLLDRVKSYNLSETAAECPSFKDVVEHPTPEEEYLALFIRYQTINIRIQRLKTTFKTISCHFYSRIMYVLSTIVDVNKESNKYKSFTAELEKERALLSLVATIVSRTVSASVEVESALANIQTVHNIQEVNLLIMRAHVNYVEDLASYMQTKITEVEHSSFFVKYCWNTEYDNLDGSELYNSWCSIVVDD